MVNIIWIYRDNLYIKLPVVLLEQTACKFQFFFCVHDNGTPLVTTVALFFHSVSCVAERRKNQTAIIMLTIHACSFTSNSFFTHIKLYIAVVSPVINTAKKIQLCRRRFLLFWGDLLSFSPKIRHKSTSNHTDL